MPSRRSVFSVSPFLALLFFLGFGPPAAAGTPIEADDVDGIHRHAWYELLKIVETQCGMGLILDLPT